MEVKDIIHTKRKALGYSLEDVARIVGVSKQTVQKWESGKISDMRRSSIAKLSKALNIPLETLMEWEDVGPAAVTQIDKNILRMAGRDGSYVEKQLTDEQAKMVKMLIDQLPDAPDY